MWRWLGVGHAGTATIQLERKEPDSIVTHFTWRHWRPALLAIIAALTLAACAFPRMHRVTVQQGNVITQEMVDQLSPGMTREQVAFVMGEPVIRNPFNADRWDYVYSMHVPGTPTAIVRMSLFFSGDELSHLTGDFAPKSAWGEEDSEAGEAEEAEAEGSESPDLAGTQ